MVFKVSGGERIGRTIKPLIVRLGQLVVEVFKKVVRENFKNCEVVSPNRQKALGRKRERNNASRQL